MRNAANGEVWLTQTRLCAYQNLPRPFKEKNKLVCKSQKTEFCSASRTKTRAKRHGLKSAIQCVLRRDTGSTFATRLFVHQVLCCVRISFPLLTIFFSKKTSGISLAVGPIGVPSKSNHPRQVVYCRCYYYSRVGHAAKRNTI